jgi:hypothetical protein
MGTAADDQKRVEIIRNGHLEVRRQWHFHVDDHAGIVCGHGTISIYQRNSTMPLYKKQGMLQDRTHKMAPHFHFHFPPVLHDRIQKIRKTAISDENHVGEKIPPFLRS